MSEGKSPKNRNTEDCTLQSYFIIYPFQLFG